MTTIRKGLSFILALLGLVIILAPYQLFPICSKLRPDGSHMSCYYSAKFFIGLGILLFLLNAFAFWRNRRNIYWLVAVLNIFLASIAYAVVNRIIAIGNIKTDGWQISYCVKDTMQCVQTFKPAINLLLPVIIVLGLFGLILNFLTRE